jgi:CO/xanthine dehydrogenase Mo-binding subunit
MIRSFGQPVRRTEDARLLEGQGTFLDDIDVPGAAHVAFVRSSVAHARIRGLDLSGVQKRSGVFAVFAHADLAELGRPLPLLFPHPNLEHPRTQHPLASDEVNFLGQPIAMVVADSRYVAEDAVEDVAVDFDELQTVVDLVSAASAESPRVHDDMPSNVAGRIVQVVGDPGSAFRDAELVLKRRYSLDRSAAQPMETRGVAAAFNERTGELQVWANTQAPSPLRAALAHILGIPEEQLHVLVPDTGGGFGVKGFFTYPEEILVPWAAVSLGRPVKWVEDRQEHFIASHHERLQVHDLEIAANRDGEVLGLRDSFLLDGGAYLPYGLELSRIAASQIAGPYRIPNLEITATTVYTNTMTCTPYRGAGRPHACFVIERGLDHLADELGLDRLDVRRRNFIGDGEFPYRREGLVTVDGYTVTLDSGAYFSQLDLLLEKLDVPAFRREQERARERGELIGLGVGCYVESTGGGPYEGARVEVHGSSGKVRISTGIPSQGQAHQTVLAQVVAEELGVTPEDVVLVGGDTREFPWGVATYASRTSVLVGNAVAEASRMVKDRALRLASNMLEVSVEDLELADGFARVRGAPERRVSLADVATAAKPDRYAFDPRAATVAAYAPARPLGRDEGPSLPPGDEPGLRAEGYFSSRNATWSSGAHAAIVRVDPETGQVAWGRYVVIHDCGRVINPLVVDGQVLGGVAQGIGGSFYERLAYDENGQLQNASFMDFLIPYATEVPRVEVHHQETLSPLNPLGIKGTGEGGAIPVPAVVAAAIEDAFERSFEIRKMPLDPCALQELSSKGVAR